MFLALPPSLLNPSTRQFTQLPRYQRSVGTTGQILGQMNMHPLKKRQKAQPAKRRRRSQTDSSGLDSTVSCESSLYKPVKVKVIRAGEKPKRCEEKSWVRINNATRGESSRTTQINRRAEEGSRYKVKPLPVGEWKTTTLRSSTTITTAWTSLKSLTCLRSKFTNTSQSTQVSIYASGSRLRPETQPVGMPPRLTVSVFSRNAQIVSGLPVVLLKWAAIALHSTKSTRCTVKGRGPI